MSKWMEVRLPYETEPERQKVQAILPQLSEIFGLISERVVEINPKQQAEEKQQN